MGPREFDKRVQGEYEAQIDKSFTEHRAYIDNCLPEKEPQAQGGKEQWSVKVIRWKTPGSSINSINFLVWRHELFVSGDLGDAVFSWGEPISMDFLEGLDYSYFIGKSRGLEGHVQCRTWMHEKVKVRMEEFLAEQNNRTKDKFCDWESHTSNTDEWNQFLAQNYELVEEEAYNWGWSINYRSLAIWIGLKRAIAFLKRQGLTPPAASQ